MRPLPAPPRVHVLHVPGVDETRDAIVSRLDEQGDVCLHPDPQRDGCMANWVRALACATITDVDLPWSVILSDDAFPIRGWQQHLERSLLSSPAPFLGLTHFGAIGQKTAAHGHAYAIGSNLIWGGAIGYHHSVREDLLRFAGKALDLGYQHDDRTIGAFAHSRGFKTAVCARAIFDQPPGIKSLLGHGGAADRRRPLLTILDDGPAPSIMDPGWNAGISVMKEQHDLIAAIAALSVPA